MQWEDREESENVEDRRRISAGGAAAGGGILTLIIAAVIFFMGGDPRPLLNNQNPNAPGGGQVARPIDPREERIAKLVKVVLKDTEDVWSAQFQKHKREYRKPVMVLYTETDQSGCGFASSAMGPFYCPADEKLYLDLKFFNELATRYKAPGDFAIAYVVAHEVGHHVQKLLEYNAKLEKLRRTLPEVEFNKWSVKLELQADYLAGAFAHYAQESKNILEAGDVEAAMRAAQAVGDDTLQRRSKGYVVPDSFTHGTSAQRAKWFRLGLKTGDLKQLKVIWDMPYEQL